MQWKFWQSFSTSQGDGKTWSAIARITGGLAGFYFVVCVVVGWWWDDEPELFDVAAHASLDAANHNRQLVTGYTTTATLSELSRILLEKRGGYLSNDVFPPGVWLDNVPNWEFGVLVQIRDMARTMRLDFSRSQSQSSEDQDLSEAEGKFFFNNASWVFPQTEDEYRKGRKHLEAYLARLADPRQPQAQFYARADNLRDWLVGVETRLGSLSQKLSASVGKRQLNLDLAGDAAATQATTAPSESTVKTAWTQLDDVFYEARGQTWALIHLLKAIELDFKDVLQKKNARVSLQQIIRELEGTQQSVWSPVILNGSGMGLVANHSLVMASYVSRANAALNDLRRLLEQG